MKKFYPILLSSLVMGGVFVVPAMAGQGYRVNVIKCGAPGTPGDCGFFPASTEPLEGGEVRADQKGRVRVQLEGAAANTTYKVYVGSFFIGGGFVQRYPDAACCRSIGTVTTDDEGEFEGPIITSSGSEFVFPTGTSLGQPSFVFTVIPTGGSETVVFTTGFAVRP
jgi:hypothetical protein